METSLLLLRQWRDEDSAPFARLNADPEVMKFFPAPLSSAASDEQMQRLRAGIDDRGWGLWAVELKDTRQFIGFTGLNIPFHAELPFNPCTEIGWRIAKPFWGKGYATEAAHASLWFAFEKLVLDEVVAFTAVLNLPSARVMQRIGMIDTGQNFLHPAVPADHKLQEHLLYKITRSQWQNNQSGQKSAVLTAV